MAVRRTEDVDLIEIAVAGDPSRTEKVPVPDPYRWLEDAASAETAEWLAEQGALFAAERETWPRREHFHSRVSELLGAGYEGVPIWRGERRFLMRRLPEQQHGVLLVVDPDGAERTLIDPMALDSSGLTTLDSWQPSKEGHLLAYQLSEGGREESVLRVMDVQTGQIVDGPVDRARYSPVAWLPGGEAYYYVRRLPADQVPDGEEQFHRRVWLHRLGEDHEADVMIFGEGLTATNYYGVSVSMDGRWLTVSAAEGTAPRNDLWVADLSASSPENPDLRPVQIGVDAQTGIRFARDGRAYMFTDRDAPRGTVLVCDIDRFDVADPEATSWSVLIPEHPEAVLCDFALIDVPSPGAAGGAEQVIACSWTRHAISEITLHDASGRLTDELALPGAGSVGGLVERPEGGHQVWFAYSDHITPTTVYRYDAQTSELSVWATPPGQVGTPEGIESELVTYTSPDGTEVRMFVISKGGRSESGESAQGPRPTVLYGYGGFGSAMTPGYSAGILAWVEAGGTYAIACLRGGSEEGEQWHRDGMLGRKQNVFDDFIAAACWLIDEGRTTPEQLAISGGSNGGLLVGAALTQAPELFSSVVCSAPLLDMMRYEVFGLGATWNVEYGSASVPEEAAWLLAYSPYHHVEEGTAYPSVLFTVFEGDTRVDPLHARKMCAALQHATTGGRVLLRSEADVGHGARSLQRSVDLSADTLSFMASTTGLE